jgi:hypothetical protein
MHTVRPSSSSLRCLTHSIPSTSRFISTNIDPNSNPGEQLSRYQKRLRRRERGHEQHEGPGPRPLYDPQKYMSSIPPPVPSSLPASTDPAFLAWIGKSGSEGGTKYQNPSIRGPNWMGGHIVSSISYLFIYNQISFYLCSALSC